jgi:hypothetical protein
MLAVLLAGGAFALWPRPRPTVEKCLSLQKGMTRAEVEAVLGPPGDYRTGPRDRYLGQQHWVTFGEHWTDDGTTVISQWECDAARIWVAYKPMPDGTIAVGFIDEAKRLDQGPLDSLLWRAKRQWRRWFPDPLYLE